MQYIYRCMYDACNMDRPHDYVIKYVHSVTFFLFMQPRTIADMQLLAVSHAAQHAPLQVSLVQVPAYHHDSGDSLPSLLLLTGAPCIVGLEGVEELLYPLQEILVLAAHHIQHAFQSENLLLVRVLLALFIVTGTSAAIIIIRGSIRCTRTVTLLLRTRAGRGGCCC